MTDTKISKIEKLGFEVSEEKGIIGERFIFRQTAPTLEEALKLLRIFTSEDCIFFWNYYYPTVSDPGAYVSAYMLDENRAVYEEGNHGWGSELKPISTEDLAQLMIKNWDKDCDRGRFLNKIEFRPNYNLKRLEKFRLPEGGSF